MNAQVKPRKRRAPSLASPVSGKYGAPMGRGNYTRNSDDSRSLYDALPEDRAELAALRAEPRRFRLELQTLDAGGYDKGGAYWGHDRAPLYFALSDDGRVFRAFRDEALRTRADVLAKLREEFPKAYTHNEPREFTRVVFRVWNHKPDKGFNGGVVALFPDLVHYGDQCQSFEHIGQHSGANYSGVIACTRPAKPDEYAPLMRELSAAPYFYDLRVVRKR